MSLLGGTTGGAGSATRVRLQRRATLPGGCSRSAVPPIDSLDLAANEPFSCCASLRNKRRARRAHNGIVTGQVCTASQSAKRGAGGTGGESCAGKETELAREREVWNEEEDRDDESRGGGYTEETRPKRDEDDALADEKGGRNDLEDLTEAVGDEAREGRREGGRAFKAGYSVDGGELCGSVGAKWELYEADARTLKRRAPREREGERCSGRRQRAATASAASTSSSRAPTRSPTTATRAHPRDSRSRRATRPQS